MGFHYRVILSSLLLAQIMEITSTASLNQHTRNDSRNAEEKPRHVVTESEHGQGEGLKHHGLQHPRPQREESDNRRLNKRSYPEDLDELPAFYTLRHVARPAFFPEDDTDSIPQLLDNVIFSNGVGIRPWDDGTEKRGFGDRMVIYEKKGFGDRMLHKKGFGERTLYKKGFGERTLHKKGFGDRTLYKKGFGERTLYKKGFGERTLYKRGFGDRMLE